MARPRTYLIACRSEDGQSGYSARNNSCPAPMSRKPSSRSYISGSVPPRAQSMSAWPKASSPDFIDRPHLLRVLYRTYCERLRSQSTAARVGTECRSGHLGLRSQWLRQTLATASESVSLSQHTLEREAPINDC